MAQLPEPPPSSGSGAVERLSPAALDVVGARAAALVGAWSIELEMDGDDVGGLALMQGGMAEEEELVFLLWLEGGRYRIGVGHGEFYADLGAHGDAEGAMRAVEQAVAAVEVARAWVGRL